MVNNYVVCLSFSHGEAELVPANEHVINIFCFQFWNEPAQPAKQSWINFDSRLMVELNQRWPVVVKWNSRQRRFVVGVSPLNQSRFYVESTVAFYVETT